MNEHDGGTMQTIRRFLGQSEMCAHQMRLNALYIQRELPNVRMNDELQQRTAGLCSGLIATEHNLLGEIVELDALLRSGGSDAEVLRLIERMVKVTWDDALKMHEIVMALAAESQNDVMNIGAHLLVSESAVNILKPLQKMRGLAAQLREVLT